MKDVSLDELYALIFAQAATNVALMRGHEEVEKMDLEYVRNVLSRAKETIEDMKKS